MTMEWEMRTVKTVFPLEPANGGEVKDGAACVESATPRRGGFLPRVSPEIWGTGFKGWR